MIKKHNIVGGIAVLIMLSTAALVISETANFDGKKFNNQPPTPSKTVWDLVQWRLTRQPEENWQPVSIPKKAELPPTTVESSKQIITTFINHATVLVQLPGANILTDPIWSERASPVSFIGPKRYHQPGLSMDELPPIDAVVISHNHYDHMDLPTLKTLNQRFKPVFFVGLKNAKWLKGIGIPAEQIIELDWWQSYALNDRVTIHGVPAKHWSTRTRLDLNEALWLGYILSSGSSQVFFAGDTGYSNHFKKIAEKFTSIELSLIPIGAYLPRYFMKDNHLSPSDAIKVHQDLQSRQSMAIHFGTFDLGDDGQKKTPKKLQELVKKADLSAEDFWVPAIGIFKNLEF